MNRSDTGEIDEFLLKLKGHAIRKSQLYDGVDKIESLDKCLRYATEELGEVATAITRDRINSVRDEAIDLAHCAMLLYIQASEQLKSLHPKDSI